MNRKDTNIWVKKLISKNRIALMIINFLHIKMKEQGYSSTENPVSYRLRNYILRTYCFPCSSVILKPKFYNDKTNQSIQLMVYIYMLSLCLHSWRISDGMKLSILIFLHEILNESCKIIKPIYIHQLSILLGMKIQDTTY